MPGPRDLPLADGQRSERADARRNRRRILEAAQRLFTEREQSSVTMGDIAQAAGVGRATLYRRYPDPASVAIALLDEHEKELQERILRGPPPLGPGAVPSQRLGAFYEAMIELLETHLPLALRAESGASRYSTGAYGFWRAHVRSLLVEGGVPDPDAYVDAALAPLDPAVYRHQVAVLGIPRSRVAAALAEQARRLLSP
jgi:AcrR family transcriptional regulator